MVVGALRQHAHLGDEAHRLHEVAEEELAHDLVASSAPAIEAGERSLDLGVGELRHRLSLLRRCEAYGSGDRFATSAARGRLAAPLDGRDTAGGSAVGGQG